VKSLPPLEGEGGDGGNSRAMDRKHFGRQGSFLAASLKAVRPGAWVEKGEAPPQGRRLDAGQELRSYQKAGAGLQARHEGKGQAGQDLEALHVHAPGQSPLLVSYPRCQLHETIER